MHRNVGALARLAASIVIAATAASAQAMAFLPGDSYTSDYSSRTINHYDASGKFVDSLVVPSSYGSEVRGLAFGQDHLLYAVTSTGSNFHVIALDQMAGDSALRTRAFLRRFIEEYFGPNDTAAVDQPCSSVIDRRNAPGAARTPAVTSTTVAATATTIQP